MPSAEIITIGTEILLGEIVDTNAPYIARNLRDLNIDLYWKTTVGDNSTRIARAIQQALERSDIVITTGGLGPTVDDPTREAVALAVGVPTEYHPDLWEQIQSRFQRFGRQPTENNKRQAYLPKGAQVIENKVGTAPAFLVEIGNKTIISLPGVPREMEYLIQNAVLPYLRFHYQLQGIIKARILHTAGVGESQIDEFVGDLEALSNPTVGLAAHSGQVDIRITAKADTLEEADQMIKKVETIVRERLGDWIYGSDRETLEEVVHKKLTELGWPLALVESGLSGALVQRLASTSGQLVGGKVLIDLLQPDELQQITESYQNEQQAKIALGVSLLPGDETQWIHIVLITPGGIQRIERPYGGPPANAPRWAIHHSLDILRNIKP